MTRQILCFILLASFAAVNAQSVKTIKPKPGKAIVYLTGAELSYYESLALVKGTNEIIVEGVSPYTDETSISAYFKGGLVIDTKKSLRYPDPPKNTSANKYALQIERISDSLEELDFLIKDCTNKQDALEKEKTLLLENRLIRGEYTKDSIDLLKASLDLLRTRLNNIYELELALERKLKNLYKLRSRLNERKTYYVLLQENGAKMVQPELYQPVHQIIVTIEAEQPVTGHLSLKYYVPNAGWMPAYEIQAASGKDKIQLVYRAQVYQNTGIDWKDIALVLSTSNPAVGNTKPTLSLWNLQYGYPQSYLENANRKRSETRSGGVFYNTPQLNQNQVEDMRAADGTNSAAGAIEPQAPVFNVNDNFFRTEYEIKTKYSIEADNKAHNVIISNIEVPVYLAYLSVPKLDRDAFLMAKVANWEDLNLLPATAKIYFDESYIGMTVVDPSTTKDTLYMNLGRDKSIIVKRQAIKEKCKEQVIGDFRVVTKTIEITVRNTKGIPLQFEVEDQIPVTSDNTIKISLEKHNATYYTENTGKLTWKLHIMPKETRKIVFTYEVKYPKDKVIAGL